MILPYDANLAGWNFRKGQRVYVMVSSDSDLDLFGTLIDRAGFRARLVHEYSIFIEFADHLRVARALADGFRPDLKSGAAFL